MLGVPFFVSLYITLPYTPLYKCIVKFSLYFYHYTNLIQILPHMKKSEGSKEGSGILGEYHFVLLNLYSYCWLQ